MLDSNILIELLNKKQTKTQYILEKLDTIDSEDLAISAIVYEEVLYGILKYINKKALPLDHPLGHFPVIAFARADAELAAIIEIQMVKKGLKKPRVDMFIAATAITNNAILFTFNIKDFDGIPDLSLL